MTVSIKQLCSLCMLILLHFLNLQQIYPKSMKSRNYSNSNNYIKKLNDPKVSSSFFSVVVNVEKKICQGIQKFRLLMQNWALIIPMLTNQNNVLFLETKLSSKFAMTLHVIILATTSGKKFIYYAKIQRTYYIKILQLSFFLSSFA